MNTATLNQDWWNHLSGRAVALLWLSWLIIAIMGSIGIIRYFSETVYYTDKIWFPPQYHLLNQVNGRILNAHTFESALPTISIDISEFQKTFNSADIVVGTPTKKLGAEVVLHVTYTAVHDGVIYRATQGFSRERMDTIEWEMPDTLHYSGLLFGGPVGGAIVWSVVLGILFLMCFVSNYGPPIMVSLLRSIRKKIRGTDTKN